MTRRALVSLLVTSATFALPGAASAQLGLPLPSVPVVPVAPLAPVAPTVTGTVTGAVETVTGTVGTVTTATGLTTTLDPVTNVVTDATGSVVGTLDSATGQVTDATGNVVATLGGTPATTTPAKTTTTPTAAKPTTITQTSNTSTAASSGDTRAPRLSLKAVKGQKAKTVRAKGLRALASCDEACAVVVYAVSGKGAKRKIIGSAVATLAANRSKTVTVKLTKAGKKTVSAKKASKIVFVGVAADGARNTSKLLERSAAVTVPRKKR